MRTGVATSTPAAGMVLPGYLWDQSQCVRRVAGPILAMCALVWLLGRILIAPVTVVAHLVSVTTHQDKVLLVCSACLAARRHQSVRFDMGDTVCPVDPLQIGFLVPGVDGGALTASMQRGLQSTIGVIAVVAMTFMRKGAARPLAAVLYLQSRSPCLDCD